MIAKQFMAAALVSAVTLTCAVVDGGLFDRLRGRSDSKVEDRDPENSPVSFEVADARDIGKIVTPVSYQPLPAPGADPALVPIPEPSVVGSPPVQSYYPTEPYLAPGVPSMGHPIASGMPAPAYPIGPSMGADGFPLFQRVKYEDRDNIHPCAVPTVVQVLDPCVDYGRRGLFHRHRAPDCDACGPRVVYVEICIPPGCHDIKVEKRGRKVKYKYDGGQAEVETKDGYVEVDYDD